MYKALLLTLFAAMPSSGNYILNGYGFTNGDGNPSSSNYQLQVSAGQAGGSPSSSSYGLPIGVRAVTTLSAPAAPTFSNPSSEYSRLKLVLNVSGFASDTKYLIAISDDNFTTTKYVQTDQTIGTALSISNYQTYAAWGGSSGSWIVGLVPSTTYKVKVAALQGSATGSVFGPTATAATIAPSVTFAVTTSLTGTPPFNALFSSLTAGSVVSANATVLADVTTNALNGGDVLIRSQNAGLSSTAASYTIASATTDLTSASTGYGAQVSSTSQGSGGPMTSMSPFNGSSNNVGALTASWQQLATFAAPVTSGNVTTTLKAKASTIVPASTDYADILTISVSLLF
ncbi:MAG TPA: hypothetical protein VL737_04345 [Candidatus Pristimantibacillus sp.]|jgi:hypothetical protein|nr:hypothetical protein [Candidatus Pristimantibacillus sp.]